MMGELDDFLLQLDSDDVLDRQLMNGTPDLPKGDNFNHLKRTKRKKPKATCLLSDDDVILVRQLWATGMTLIEIADKFDVSVALIDAIMRRKRRGGVR